MKTRAAKSASPEKVKPTKKTSRGSFPIVAIGASAGGLEAFTDFFHALPADTGMGFALIQHLDPSHHSMLAEIIAKSTAMSVEEVKSGTEIRPNRVYVIPPNAQMAIVDCVFQLSPRGKTPGQHLAVNHFMHSLAQEHKSRAIGIVLSGTGADGTAGLEDIKAEGGITFVQEPSSAKYDGMPRSAVDSGCVDFVLPPRDIAKELQRIQHHPYVRVLPSADLPDGGGDAKVSSVLGQVEQAKELADSVAPASHEKDFHTILAQLRKTSGVDFSQYKPNTIHRRALRRMVILKLDSLRDYAQHLKDHPDEGHKLYDDVLIPVTSFFRDFEAFEALKTQVYPAIVKDKASKGTIRMWAPGCSTGEETYSLAMTLLEFLGDRASSFQVQIFGTDLNEKGIQKARTGVYRESIADEISPERMQRFFVKVDEGYRVNKAVRDLCVFAKQNVATDPPFSQMNVVACRNLLIYIQPALQRKIVPILHYALKPSGFLVLGGSESVSAFPELFSVVDKKHKIYAKKTVATRLHYDFAESYYPAQGALEAPNRTFKALVPASDEPDIQAEADRVVLKHHAPVGVVINAAMEVVQFRGRTTPYLEPAPGKPSLNVLKLARNGLALELRTLIAAAQKKRTLVRKDGVPFDGNGHKRYLNLSVTPLGGGSRFPDGNDKQEKQRQKGKDRVGGRFFLVLFEDVTPQWDESGSADGKGRSRFPDGNDRKKGKVDAADKQETKRLKRELGQTQDALRVAVESEDSLKEEFQSANEEILSANEELQSTNEELETSKEELQSANEELNTLNSELRTKNSELQELTNDISNLLTSTRIPVVMLDRSRRIRRITPAATRLFKVLPSDIGRPFTDIKLNIEPEDLTPSDLDRMVSTVLENLQPIEREVRDQEQRWYELSVQPYQTQDNRIDGVVLALQDIDAIKSASEQLRKSAEFFRGIIDTVREPLLALDADLRVVSANNSFLETFQVSPDGTLNRPLYELGNGQWNIPALRALLERILPKREVVTDLEVDHDFERIGYRKVLLNARRLTQPSEMQPTILLAIEDVTERKRAEEAVARLAAIVESSDDAIVAKNLDGIIQTWNRGAEKLFGYTKEEAVGQSITILMPPDRAYEEPGILERIRHGEHIEHYESIRRRKDGKLLEVSLTISPIVDAHGQIVGASKIARDVTERNQVEAKLRASEAKYRMLFEGMDEGFCVIEKVEGGTNGKLDFRYVVTNPAFDVQSGVGSVLGKTIRQVVPNESEEWFQTYNSVLETGKSVRFQRVLGATGRILDCYAFRVGDETDRQVSVIFKDITASKAAEAALIRSEKLAASGRLAATLAHEINNPLQAVTNLLDLLGQSSKLGEEDRRYTTMAVDELGRVTHLVRQSLGFYRETTSAVAIDLEAMVAGILRLYAKPLAAKKIAVNTQYEAEGTKIESYPSAIRQVLSTLLVNATEAVPDEGMIAIRVRRSFHWKNPAVRGIRVTVGDKGGGISPAHRSRIFEPFFTTKGERGTGLGLWVARGILDGLGGTINLRSSVHSGKSGTCFSIFLPHRMPDAG